MSSTCSVRGLSLGTRVSGRASRPNNFTALAAGAWLLLAAAEPAPEAAAGTATPAWAAVFGGEAGVVAR